MDKPKKFWISLFAWLLVGIGFYLSFSNTHWFVNDRVYFLFAGFLVIFFREKLYKVIN